MSELEQELKIVLGQDKYLEVSESINKRLSEVIRMSTVEHAKLLTKLITENECQKALIEYQKQKISKLQ